jgi:hypothetical protein
MIDSLTPEQRSERMSRIRGSMEERQAQLAVMAKRTQRRRVVVRAISLLVEDCRPE